MDDKLRKAQRQYKSVGDNASEYIRVLEQRLGIIPEFKGKIQNSDPTVVCLICEKDIQRDETTESDKNWIYFHNKQLCLTNPEDAVSVYCNGNYGSRVLDGSKIFFYICDDCLINNSHKMFFISEYGPGRTIENARESEEFGG